MKLKQLHRDIMSFAKREGFQVTIEDFINKNPDIDKDVAISSLRELKVNRIVSVAEPIEINVIEVTDYGHSVLGWH